MDSLMLQSIRRAARPFGDSLAELRPLLDELGGARLVLLGEASHGTHEFYWLRAELSKRLIADYGFDFVAVEADWPDAYQVNRWVQGSAEEAGAAAAFDDFTRFPLWMWRN